LSGKFDVQYNKNFLSVHDIFVNAGFDLSRKQSSTNLQQAEGFPSDKMTDIIFARQYLKDAKPKGTEETVKDGNIRMRPMRYKLPSFGNRSSLSSPSDAVG